MQEHTRAECDALLAAAERQEAVLARREAGLARAALRAEARAARLQEELDSLRVGPAAAAAAAVSGAGGRASARPQLAGLGPLAGPAGAAAAAAQEWLQVRVPAGARGGATLDVRLPDGSTARVRVPHGAHEGDVVQVRRAPM